MEKVIQVENVSKKYGNIAAVQNLNLAVEKGTAFGLLGANGAGKSTTIECILGTKNMDQGSVSILGLDPKKDRKKLFKQVGVQFQEAHYQEKIIVGELCESTACLYSRPENYRTLLRQFQLEDKIKSPVNTLSGGERQKLFIVLALIPNPKVVFLDELTTGLDVKARRDVWRGIKALKEKGLTIMMTSHFMDEVKVLCDRICILKKGERVFYGTVAEAIAQSPYDSFENSYLWFTGEETEEMNFDENI